MKIRMINALDGLRGRRGLGQVGPQGPFQSLVVLTGQLSSVQAKIHRHRSDLGVSLYNELSAEHSRLVNELRELDRLLSDPDRVDEWPAAFESAQRKVMAFEARVDSILRTERGLRGPRAAYLALGTVIVLGGVGALFVYLSRPVRRKRRRKRRK